MFGIIIYDILFFAIPAIIIALLGVSIYRYLSAKRRNKLTPGTVSNEEVKKRKILLIVSAILAGTLAVVVIGFIALLFMAVAFM